MEPLDPSKPQPRLRRQRPSEPSDKEQLDAVMKQIQMLSTPSAASEEKAPAQQHKDLAAAVIPPKSEVSLFAPASESLPAVEDVATQQSGVLLDDDLVQIVDPASHQYGVVYAVGDVSGGRVHGYHIGPSRRKEFITARLDQVVVVGKPAVKAREKVSRQWSQSIHDSDARIG